MESNKLNTNIYIFKDYKKMIMSVSLLFILFVVFYGLFLLYLNNKFLNIFIQNSENIAGYLSNNCDLEEIDIIKIFNKDINEDDIFTGKIILNKIGYGSNISNESFFKYNFFLLIISIIFFIIQFFTVSILIKQHHKQIETATKKMEDFLNNNKFTYLNEENYYSFSYLFYTINRLLTNIKVYLDFEKNSKQFLKDIISDISHQLKTPLSALYIYTDIIINEKNNINIIEKFTAKIQKSLTRIEKLIRQLLMVAKLDSGSFVFTKKSISIKEMFSNITSELLIEKRKIIYNGSNKIKLFCDYDWMYEALSNILKNSIEHTDFDGIINISWEKTPVCIFLTIKDNGVGIHKEDINFIFKKFYRSKYAKSSQGIGLGLPLAKQIIELHDGNIMIESSYGKGSCFTITFNNISKM